MGAKIKNAKQFETRLKAIQVKIAASRDELRDLLASAEELESDVTEATESIEYAIDALSRLQ